MAWFQDGQERWEKWTKALEQIERWCLNRRDPAELAYSIEGEVREGKWSLAYRQTDRVGIRPHFKRHWLPAARW